MSAVPEALPGTFRVESERGDGWVRLAPAGELDVMTASRLEGALEVAEAFDPREIYVDLRGLTFVSSSGVSVLEGARVRARRGGWRLKLVQGGQAVMRILEFANARRPREDAFEIVAEPPAAPA